VYAVAALLYFGTVGIENKVDAASPRTPDVRTNSNWSSRRRGEQVLDWSIKRAWRLVPE